MSRQALAGRRALADTPQDAPQDAPSVLLPDGSEGIPPHVWQTLQDAGEEAAARLLELLRPERFRGLPPATQRGLLDLALTRAYGLPVRRSVNVSLGKGDLDAVARSLADLGEALPENGREMAVEGVSLGQGTDDA